MKFKTFIILFLIVSAEVFSADFISYYANFSQQLYNGDEIVYDNFTKFNGWNRIFDIYMKLYGFRMSKEINADLINDEIEDIIDDISDDDIKGLSAYEKELLTGLLYGSLAYLESEDPSFRMFRNIKKSRNLFENLRNSYKTIDSEFGASLSEIALGLYFQDSFWVKSVLRYYGNILNSLKELDNIAFKGGVTKVEANLFLIEYYAQDLGDHNSSIKYSGNLFESYPKSNFFKYLYAEDLYHTGKIKQAFLLFKDINGNISDKFYAFNYEAIIYEAKCLYILGDNTSADEVINFAGGIHNGYILEKFRNEWKSSIRIRQDAIYRAQYSQGTDLKLSGDELKRTALIMFDHGYFRETDRLTGMIEPQDAETLVLAFKTSVIMQNWKKAKILLDLMEKEYEDFLEINQDRERILILKNIVLNFS